MNSTELTKLAQSDPQVAEALLTLVKEATDQTQFNESIPSLAQANGGAGSPSATSGSQPAQLGQPGQGQPPMQDANAQAMQMAGNSPGIDMAKAFLQDVIQAAAGGDVNAQRVVAMTAAEMARADSGQAGPVVPQESPEAAAANQIVADPNAAPAAAPGAVPPAAAPAAAPAPAPAAEAAPTQAVVADATPPAEQAAQAGEAVGEAKGKEEGKKTGKEEGKKEEKKDEGKEKKKPPFMEKKSSYTPEDVATIVQLVRDGIL